MGADHQKDKVMISRSLEFSGAHPHLQRGEERLETELIIDLVYVTKPL